VSEPAWLDEPIIHQPRVTRWTLLYLLLVLLILGTRLWDLGSRAYCHDEAIHAWESWKLANGLGYVHDPPYHGPFLYHATALVFALLGDSNVTGRLAAVLGGILITLAPWYLRRWLGRWGALAATLFMALSPVLMHRSRFIRHDQFAIVANLILFVAILRYLEGRRTRDLYLAAAAVAWGFTTKETTFITYALFGLFLAGYALWQWLRHRVTASPRLPFAASLRALPVFDLIVVIGTLVLPLASPIALVLMGRDPMDTSAQGIMVSALVWLGFFLVAAAIGILWDAKRWTVCAALFAAIFVPLYTTMFTNAQGFASGMMGQLGYWLSQQGVARGGQPWFYYFLLLGMYEFAPLLVGAGAIVYAGLRGLARRSAPRASPSPAISGAAFAVADSALPADAAIGSSALPADVPDERPLVGPGSDRVIVPFLIWWFLGALLLYTWAGEKMPWLTLHLVTPLHLLAGWGLGKMVEAVTERRGDAETRGCGDAEMQGYGDAETRGCGDAETRRHGDTETRGYGDAETRGSGDAETRGCGDAETRGSGDAETWGSGNAETQESPSLPVTASPCLPVTASPRLPLTPSPLDLAPLAAAPLLALFALLNRGAAPGASALNQLVARWAGWIAAGLLAAWIARLAARGGLRRALRLAALSVVATLLLLTVRVAWMATYQHADLASEFLVYAQGTPDVARVAGDLEALSYRLTGGLDIKVAYDEDAAWPFIWYLRNYTNAQYFRDRPAEPIDADVIIVGEDNEAALAPLLQDNYVGRQYRLIWWPNEDWYKEWTWASLWEQISTPRGREKLWDVFWRRKYDYSLQDWPAHLKHTFTLYVRRDLALPLGAPR